MSESLFSQSWYRVSGLKVRLRSHARILRHTYRNQVWFVLQDHASGKFHRLTPEACSIISLMDGKRTLQQVWESACRQLGDDMPTQDEMISLLGRLHRADVLQADLLPDIGDLHERQRTGRRKKILQQFKSPLGIRIPLLDPERFLQWSYPFVSPFLGWFGAAVWLSVVVTASMLAAVHWESLTSNVADRLLAADNLILLVLVYPLVKLLHELGHAYAVKRWGGEVHEMGVMLLVFMPVPYVEASAASAYRNKYQRVFVSAAGILSEVFIAGLAMILWVYAEPGVMRAVLFNVMLVAGVSTVLFNGNPLLRFDAYYMLGDLLEIPNLGTRGNQYIGYLAKRYLLRIKDAISPVTAPGEAGWLGGYAIISFFYRMFIMVVIIMFVATQFFVVGVVLAIWAFINTLVMPLWKVVSSFFSDSQLQAQRGRASVLALVSLSIILLIIFVLPMPLTTRVEGVSWAPEQSQIRVDANGFVETVVATPEQKVMRGEPLFITTNPEVDAQVAIAQAQLNEARARYRANVGARAEQAVIREEIKQFEEELRREEERRAALNIQSDRDGTFIVSEAHNLPGRYVTRGETLGYVIDSEQIPVRAVVSQDFIDLLRNRTLSVEVRFSSDIAQAYPAKVIQEVPAASHQLPSMVLSTQAGGEIAVDPSAKEPGSAYNKIFQFELEVASVNITRINERVYVLFRHPPEPLAKRIYRSVRRLLLSQFDT